MEHSLQETGREPSVEELDRDECLRLLATESVGRVAVGQGAWAPHVVPVNYRLVGDTIVFRTGPGRKLSKVLTDPVSFEVDCADTVHRTGWSVLVQGLAYRASAWEVEACHLDVEPFAPGDKAVWVRLVSHSITGRRITLTPEPAFDPRGYL